MLDIVIVNWNGGDFLFKCLESLTASSADIDIKIIVVDNNSQDDSTLRINKFKHTFIKNNKNLGFAAGCNIGASYGNNKYILFLNPDTVVNHNSLMGPIDFLEYGNSSKIAAVGIKMIDFDGRFSTTLARFPNIKSIIIQIFHIDKIFSSRIKGRFLTEEECKNDQFVEEINGSFLLIRRDVFEELKGFDERFFMYCDELDLCKRIQNLGYDLYYLSRFSAMHYGGGSSNSIPVKRAIYALNSKIKYVRKHTNVFISLFLILLILLIEYPSKIYYLLIKHWVKK